MINIFVCACVHSCVFTLRALCVLIMLSILGMHRLEVTGLRSGLNKETHKMLNMQSLAMRVAFTLKVVATTF